MQFNVRTPNNNNKWTKVPEFSTVWSSTYSNQGLQKMYIHLDILPNVSSRWEQPVVTKWWFQGTKASLERLTHRIFPKFLLFRKKLCVKAGHILSKQRDLLSWWKQRFSVTVWTNLVIVDLLGQFSIHMGRNWNGKCMEKTVQGYLNWTDLKIKKAVKSICEWVISTVNAGSRAHYLKNPKGSERRMMYVLVFFKRK